MSLADIIYKNLFNESICNEGGNAIANVDRIPRAYIQPTIKKIYQFIIKPLYGPGVDYFLLGSTGKKATSGDIDIAINLHSIDEKNISTNLQLLNKQIFDVFGNSCEIQINTITNDMIHFSFPQYNEKGIETDKTVQVDILLTQYPEFCKFYMYSPTEIESKYKGAHRNELLRSIAYVINHKNLKIDEDGNPVMWLQYDINSNGFYRDVKSLIDEDGNRLKYKDTDEDLIPAYAQIIKSKLVTHNPHKVVDMLIGKTFDLSDIDTFEKLFNIIKNNDNFKYTSESLEILHQCAKSIKENSKLLFPIELEPYLEML